MDWNEDGLLDIIVGDRDGYINYFRRTSNTDVTLTEEPDIQANGSTIDVGANSAPVVVDWDEDGLHDLIVGQQSTSPGSIRLYLNSGTAGDPTFTDYSYVTSAGSNISHYRCCPQVHDMNGDGKKDLLAAENNGYIYYYENVGTNADPEFNGSERLQSEGSDIDLYYGARIWVDDWDEDGYPDILASDYDGYVYQYLAYPTGVSGGHNASVAGAFGMDLAGPNPTTGSIRLWLDLPGRGQVEIDVFSVEGRCVHRESPGSFRPGTHTLGMDLSSLDPGVYLISCRVEDAVLTEKVVLTE